MRNAWNSLSSSAFPHTTHGRFFCDLSAKTPQTSPPATPTPRQARLHKAHGILCLEPPRSWKNRAFGRAECTFSLCAHGTWKLVEDRLEGSNSAHHSFNGTLARWRSWGSKRARARDNNNTDSIDSIKTSKASSETIDFQESEISILGDL